MDEILTVREALDLLRCAKDLDKPCKNEPKISRRKARGYYVSGLLGMKDDALVPPIMTMGILDEFGKEKEHAVEICEAGSQRERSC